MLKPGLSSKTLFQLVKCPFCINFRSNVCLWTTVSKICSGKDGKIANGYLVKTIDCITLTHQPRFFPIIFYTMICKGQLINLKFSFHYSTYHVESDSLWGKLCVMNHPTGFLNRVHCFLQLKQISVHTDFKELKPINCGKEETFERAVISQCRIIMLNCLQKLSFCHKLHTTHLHTCILHTGFTKSYHSCPIYIKV